jgi:hypothetical protein
VFRTARATSAARPTGPAASKSWSVSFAVLDDDLTDLGEIGQAGRGRTFFAGCHDLAYKVSDYLIRQETS